MTEAGKDFKSAHGPSAVLAGIVERLFETAGSSHEEEHAAALAELQVALPSVSPAEAYAALSQLLEDIPYPTSDKVAQIAVDLADTGNLGELLIKTIHLADIVTDMPGYADLVQPEGNEDAEPVRVLPTASSLRQSVADGFSGLTYRQALKVFETILPDIEGLKASSREMVVEQFVTHATAFSIAGGDDPATADRFYALFIPMSDASLGDEKAASLDEVLFDRVSHARKVDILNAKIRGFIVDLPPEQAVEGFAARFGKTAGDFLNEDGSPKDAAEILGTPVTSPQLALDLPKNEAV